MTSSAIPPSPDPGLRSDVPLFDEFAEAAITEVRRSFPEVSSVVVADLVRAYRPYSFTPMQDAHACKQRLRDAIAF